VQSNKRIIEITQDLRSASDQDTVSSDETANKKTIERIDAGATEAPPKAGAPETEGNGDSQEGNGDDNFISKWRHKQFRKVSK
jgi:hypothetical protein